jgi:uncharacterized membrane protein
MNDSPEPKKEGKAKRIISIDVLRGIVIVIMALDHAREYFSSFRFSPTDLTHTTSALFMTRWITHFCAPVFVFLAGTGAFLYYESRGRSAEKTSFFLWSRGLFLVFMEIVVVRFAASFNFNYFDSGANILQVIWAIGWSMIFLSLLVRLPSRVIALIGGAIVVFHDLLDGVRPLVPASLQWLFTILHVRDYITVAPGIEFLVTYPLIPWIGVIALGYAFGNLVTLGEAKKRRTLLWLGLGLTAAFFILRLANIYGDPQPWAVQESLLLTVFSFINCAKYPPSLLFLLMTLGPAILLLSFLKEEENPLSGFFLVLGRAPMIFYLAHIFLLHLIAMVFAWLRYGAFPSWMLSGNPIFSQPAYPLGPADYGYGLIVVYLVWLFAVLVLRPFCSWYIKYKKAHKYFWLSYL